MNIQEVYENFKKNILDSDIYKYEEMKKHTTFKVGGKADIFVRVNTIKDLKYILEYSKENNIIVTIIGNGSNVIVKDNGIRGITIQINLDKIEITQIDNEKVSIKVEAGYKIGKLSAILQKEEVSGFEFASGIPGTIGGAIKMNAGAYGKEIKEIVKQVTYMDREGNIYTKDNKDMDFSYRHSRFKENDDIILEAVLELQKGNKEEIKNKIEEYRKSRNEKQPTDMPSAGSTFKRGENYITAQLIDEAELKGYSIGGAMVSKKHAGFIVNTGNATAKDILKLVDYITKTIYDKYGKKIELEVEVIGE